MTTKEIVNLLFEVRDNVHIIHLQTTEYSKHKILGCLYEELVDCVDGFIELCQGIKGEILYEIGNIQIREGVDIVSYLKEVISKLEHYRENPDHFLLGIYLENTLMLLYKNIYLLKLKG